MAEKKFMAALPSSGGHGVRTRNGRKVSGELAAVLSVDVLVKIAKTFEDRLTEMFLTMDKHRKEHPHTDMHAEYDPMYPFRFSKPTFTDMMQVCRGWCDGIRAVDVDQLWQQALEIRFPKQTALFLRHRPANMTCAAFHVKLQRAAGVHRTDLAAGYTRVRDRSEVAALYAVPPGYLEERQANLTGVHRGTVLDWLFQMATALQQDFVLVLRALSYLDRYLACTTIQRDRLPLVGAGAFLLATRHESVCNAKTVSAGDVAARLASDFEFGGFGESADEVAQTEGSIVRELHFELPTVTALDFLDSIVWTLLSRFPHLKELSTYLCEISSFECTQLSFGPATNAAASVRLAAFGLNIPWISCTDRSTDIRTAALRALGLKGVVTDRVEPPMELRHSIRTMLKAWRNAAHNAMLLHVRAKYVGRFVLTVTPPALSTPDLGEKRGFLV